MRAKPQPRWHFRYSICTSCPQFKTDGQVSCWRALKLAQALKEINARPDAGWGYVTIPNCEPVEGEAPITNS